jgi:hypothetical protein
VITLLGACVPAAKILARVIEGKANTLTIGGASMFGLFLAPWIVAAMNTVFHGDGGGGHIAAARRVGDCRDCVCVRGGDGASGLSQLRLLLWSASESESSLACPNCLRSIMRCLSAETRKAAYERNLEAVPLVPIQAMTAAVSVASGHGRALAVLSAAGWWRHSW